MMNANASECPYCGVPMGAARPRGGGGPSFTDRLMPNGKMAVALLLLVNSALFIAITVSGSRMLPQYGAKWLPAILSGDWYRLITAGYLHTQFFHILMNMMGLYNIGPIVEEIYGTRRMFALYTVATIVGFILSCMWSPRVPSLGASAGIFGLLGALIAYGMHSKSAIARHLQTQCLMNAGIGFVMGGLLPQIDNAAHLGGLAGGFAVAYLAGLPRWVDDSKEKLWGLVALVSLLLTFWAFYELTYRIFLRSAG
jgi:rhomboid protease GluP